MTFKTFLKAYWRVPVVAVLGALIAFGGSFLLEESYTSSTRVLIRGRDTSFNTTTPGDPQQGTGINDQSGARSIAETQAGLASSREVAEKVVDQLGLDQKKEEKSGPIHTLAKGAAWTYSHARAILTFGFYKEADKREKAIATVMGGVTAHQLGTTSGGATGQPASYVLEIVATGTTPTEARDIANADADALVQVSNQRFADDSANYVAALEGQLTDAGDAVAKTANAVSDYKVANNVSAVDQQLVDNALSTQNLTDSIRKSESDLAAAQGTVSSLKNSIAATPPTVKSNQLIQTGRSGTNVDDTQPNPVYQDLQNQLAQAQASVSALTAQLAAQQAQVGTDSPATLNSAQAGLLSLEQDLDLAKDTQTKLSGSLTSAKTDQASGKTELTRVSVASLSTYPTSPKRYLFLLLGLLVGGLAGGGLTWLAHRRNPAGGTDEDELDDLDREILVEQRAQERNASWEPVGAGANGGPGGGPAGGSNGRSSLFGRRRTLAGPSTARDDDLTDPGQR